MKTRSIRILSLESKDIYAAMNLVNGDGSGYNIRNKDGAISLRKFENTLDWSLDTIKLQEEYEKAVRRKDFYFVVNKRKYTQVIINVKFSYSYKEFNKVGKNVYVRDGYDFRDCVFTDGVCIKDGLIVGIQTNVEVLNEVPKELIPPYFTYADGCYQLTGAIPVIKNKADLRQELYENGFVCDGVKYVRYKRSAGSSRVGKCLFVNEVVAKRMARWDRCGLTIRDNAPIDLASFEAYIALPMSSIIDTMIIEPENILIVDDFESCFKDKVIAVEEKDGRLVASEKEVDVTNCIWDGESLLDVSMFGEYASKGMVLLRNRFFKTCAFNANIQQWFADNGITSVEQLNGFTLAKDISQVKLITTPSSVKYLKFGSIEDWLANIEHTFGIVKYEKETHFFGGRMVQCHYQLLNTLQLSYKDVEELLKPSLAYVGAIRQDPAVLRYHIGYAFKNEEEDAKSAIDDKISDIENKISAIPKFSISVVSARPTSDISETTIYLVKTGDDSENLYTEYIFVNGTWETLGTQALNLTGYATETWVNTKIANFVTEARVNELIAAAAVKTAEAADKLSTARKISVSGDLTGETTFDGSGDATIPVTLSQTGVVAGVYSAVEVDEKGRVTAGSQAIEVGTAGQTTPSQNLAVGGLFFKLL